MFDFSDNVTLNTVIICCAEASPVVAAAKALLPSGPSWLDLPMKSCVALDTALSVLFRAPPRRTGLGVVKKETPSRCSFGCSLRLPRSHLLLRMPAALITRRMNFLSFRQLADAAFRCWRWVPRLRYSSGRWPPPHHKQLGGWLQFVHTCPNFWQL